MTIGVGLIGYGFAGSKLHLPLIAQTPGLVLKRIATSNPGRASSPPAGVQWASNAAEAILPADVQLVVIATPNDSHYELAMRALHAGKHVVVEKPFTVDAVQAAELAKLALEKRLVLSVFHNRRWDSDFLTVRRCIESGLLGEVNSFYSSRDRFRPEVRVRWKEQALPGSGTLHDLGAHLIDQTLTLFGMPRAVTADIAAQRAGGQAPDYFHLTLDYGRMRAILHSSSLASQPGPRFHVHGSLGSYRKHGEDVQEAALIAGKPPVGPEWGVEPPSAAGDVTLLQHGLAITGKVDTVAGDYKAYYLGMVEAILHGRPAPVTADEAIRVMRVIDAAQASSREGRSIRLE